MNTTGKMACCEYVAHTHVAVMALRLCSGTEVKGWYGWTDNRSSNCHFRTGAEQNRNDGFQIPDSSQSASPALCRPMPPYIRPLRTESWSLNN